MQFSRPTAKAAAQTVKSADKRAGKGALECRCIEKGVRITAIRQAVIDTLERASCYLTAEEVYLRANQSNASVSMSAAYVSLKMLADHGLIERRKFQSKRNYYATTELGHCDQLIDMASGRVTEFHNRVLDQLKEKIAREHGYNPTDCRVEFYVSVGERYFTTGHSHDG